MSAPPAVPAASPPSPTLGTGPTWRRRALLWGALVALLAIAQSALVWLTLNYESTRAQEQVEGVSAAAAADIKRILSRDLQGVHDGRRLRQSVRDGLHRWR